MKVKNIIIGIKSTDDFFQEILQDWGKLQKKKVPKGKEAITMDDIQPPSDRLDADHIKEAQDYLEYLNKMIENPRLSEDASMVIYKFQQQFPCLRSLYFLLLFRIYQKFLAKHSLLRKKKKWLFEF